MTAEQIGDAAHAAGARLHQLATRQATLEEAFLAATGLVGGVPRHAGEHGMIDALRYEYVRLRTIRSTYWLIGLALAFQLVMSLLIAWRMSVAANPPSGDDAFDVLATIGASAGLAPLFIAYIIGLLGVFSTGHEYRHGMIRATLTAVPNRSHVFVAKVISTAAIVRRWRRSAASSIALGGAAGFGLDMPSTGELVNLTAGTVIYTALFALSGLAYAAITRNQTAAVALLMLVPTLVEQIIKAIILAIKSASDDPRGTGGLVQILKFLPYDAGGQMYTRASIERPARLLRRACRSARSAAVSSWGCSSAGCSPSRTRCSSVATRDGHHTRRRLREWHAMTSRSRREPIPRRSRDGSRRPTTSS